MDRLSGPPAYRWIYFVFALFTWEGAWECGVATTATLNFGVLESEAAATAAALVFVLFSAWVMLICALLAFEDNGAKTPKVRPATVVAIIILFFIFFLEIGRAHV